MPDLSKFARRSLGELADFVNGYPFGPEDWGPSGLPIIRIAQMTSPDVVGDRYAGNIGQRYRIDTGDLVMSWSGTIAMARWARGPAWLNQHLFKVVVRNCVDDRFFAHLLQNALPRLEASAHGTTMRHIKRGDLLNYSVEIPGIREQRRIAEVLDAIDDTIRSVEHSITKLNAVRMGLSHEIFGREKWDPRLSVRLLGDVLAAAPRNGVSPVESADWKGTFMLGLGCLGRSGFGSTQLKFAPSLDGRMRSVLLNDGDLLMSRSNTRDRVGFVGVYRDVGAPCIYPDLMMRLRPGPLVGAQFLAHSLASAPARKAIQAFASGTSGSMVKISGRDVMSLQVPVIDLVYQQEVITTFSRHAGVMAAERRRLSKLRETRTALADDLLSGRVRVPA